MNRAVSERGVNVSDRLQFSIASLISFIVGKRYRPSSRTPEGAYQRVFVVYVVVGSLSLLKYLTSRLVFKFIKLNGLGEIFIQRTTEARDRELKELWRGPNLKA